MRLRKALMNRSNNYQILGTFAHTKVEPIIYWRPANGNEASDVYVEMSRNEMKQRLEEERNRIESDIRGLKEQ